jgi:hypothetical protein
VNKDFDEIHFFGDKTFKVGFGRVRERRPGAATAWERRPAGASGLPASTHARWACS